MEGSGKRVKRSEKNAFGGERISRGKHNLIIYLLSTLGRVVHFIHSVCQRTLPRVSEALRCPLTAESHFSMSQASLSRETKQLMPTPRGHRPPRLRGECLVYSTIRLSKHDHRASRGLSRMRRRRQGTVKRVGWRGG